MERDDLGENENYEYQDLKQKSEFHSLTNIDQPKITDICSICGGHSFKLSSGSQMMSCTMCGNVQIENNEYTLEYQELGRLRQHRIINKHPKQPKHKSKKEAPDDNLTYLLAFQYKLKECGEAARRELGLNGKFEEEVKKLWVGFLEQAEGTRVELTSMHNRVTGERAVGGGVVGKEGVGDIGGGGGDAKEKL